MITAGMSPIDMGRSLGAAGAQNVRLQLGAAGAQQAGIGAAGTDFSLPKSVPKGQHRSVPPAAGFATIGSGTDDRDRHHDAILLCCQTYLCRARILAGSCCGLRVVALMWAVFLSV
jgi:hypothetical protein